MNNIISRDIVLIQSPRRPTIKRFVSIVRQVEFNAKMSLVVNATATIMQVKGV